MKIGILLPNLLASERFKNRIYAPKDLAIHLADGLIEQGHEVKIYSSKSLKTNAEIVPGIEELETDPKESARDALKSEDIRSELSHLRNNFEYGLDLLSKVLVDAKNGEIEILHSYEEHLSHYFVNQCVVPVVYTLHDQVFKSDSFEFWRLKRFAGHNYIALSQAQQKSYEDNMGLNIVKSIYHGIDPNSIPFSDVSGEDMLFIGRIQPQKGVEDAIRAAITLKHKLSIATSSNYTETAYYQKEVLPFLNSEFVHDVGYLSGVPKNMAIQQSKVVLLPIKAAESFGMIMIESMLAGTPVVAYSWGSVGEIIVDGKTGFLVDQSDGIDGFTKAISKIYAMSSEDYRQMRINCREHVIKNFSLKKMIDAHAELYKQMVSRSK